IDAGAELVELVDAPPDGEDSVDDLFDACEAALDAGTPSVAIAQLSGILAAGVRPTDVARLAAVAAPILGE
ncbi:MAG: hypothetical protein JO054_18360, partial [Actinobacteria bacterium]|nr:hypothetical protein [Actinomycetota bacterium]